MVGSVTAPSNSPEKYIHHAQWLQGKIPVGAHNGYARFAEIFYGYYWICKILNIDWSLQIICSRQKIIWRPNQISPTDGGIQEWLHDWPSPSRSTGMCLICLGLYPMMKLLFGIRLILQLPQKDPWFWGVMAVPVGAKAWKICFRQGWVMAIMPYDV